MTEVKKGEASKPNVKALQEFRLKGKVVGVGDVVAKSDFPNKQDWLNLLNMPKSRVEETSDKVSVSKPEDRVKAAAAAKAGKSEASGSAPKAPGA